MTQTLQAHASRRPLTLRVGSATFVIALVGLMIVNLSPVIVTALGTIGFDVVTSGGILTWSLLAAAVAGISSSRLAAGKHRLRLARTGLALAIVSFVTAAFAPYPALAAAGLITGGACTGLAASTSGAALASLRNPNRVSATSGLVNRVLVTCLLIALPMIGITQESVFGAIGVVTTVAWFLVRWLPDAMDGSATDPRPLEPSNATETRRTRFAGIILLFLLPLWGISEDSVWSMARVIGEDIGLDDFALGAAVSMASGGGILGMLFVIILGHRIGRTVPLVTALLVSGVLKYALAASSDPAQFTALLIGINTLYAFAFVLFLATAAGLDQYGRWSAPLVGVYLIGSSFAPLVGATLSEWYGPLGFTTFMGTATLLFTLPALFVARESIRRERRII